MPVEFLVYDKVVIKQEFKDNKLLALAKEIDELGDAETIGLGKEVYEEVD